MAAVAISDAQERVRAALERFRREFSVSPGPSAWAGSKRLLPLEEHVCVHTQSPR
jgi:hypothetical protein